MNSQTAANFASLFYLGITFGRFLCGFIADKFGDKNMIRMGVATMFLGVVLVMIPVNITIIPLVGLMIAGIGAAPVYTCIIHATPNNFGKENSHAIIGIQMASAYVGSTFMPPVFGFLAENVNIAIYPFYLLVFVVLLFVMSEKVNRVVGNR